MSSDTLRIVEPFDFQWTVPARGYEWVQAYVSSRTPAEEDWFEEPQWLLVHKDPGGRKRPPYRPLHDFRFLGLFRVFAEVKLCREAILEFANQYGALGIPRPGTLNHPWPPWPEFEGETLNDWAWQIEKMRQAVEVWDMLQTKHKKGLQRLIRWGHRVRPGGIPNSGPFWWFYRSHPDTAPPNIEPRGIPAWPGESKDDMLAIPGMAEEGDLLTPARIFLAKWVTQSLKGAASPAMHYDKEYQRLNLQIVPQTLLAALWLQLARAIDTDKTYRRCKACPRWFEVSAGNSRTDRLFCSDACKSRDYRAKKQEAIRLRGEKWTPQQIAKELGATPEVIKRWLKDSKVK
jgi:hypothetical protein